MGRFLDGDKARPVGRPSKLTPENVRKILAARKLGLTAWRACALVGVGKSTYHQWLERAEADRQAGKRTEYVEFADALEHALNEGVTTWLARVEQAAAEGDWRAAKFKLAVTLPDEYTERVRTEVTGAVGAEPVKVEHSGYVAYMPRQAGTEDEWQAEATTHSTLAADE